MRILCCVKRVPAPGSKITVTDDEQSVDTAHLGFTTSPHEECALEEAVQIREQQGDDTVVAVLTAGPPEAEEQLRYAASVGATELVLIPVESGEWDPQQTATAITEAITQVEAQDGVFDLILFGNESADSGGFQVGVRVAHKLGRPMVNAVKGIEVSDDTITASREIDGGFEVYSLPRPAICGVKEGLNLPRYPTMRGRLASKKATVATVASTPAAGGQAKVRLHRPAEQASNTEILGNGPDAAPAIVDLLESIGVL